MRIITTEMREAVNALRNISQAWPEKSFTHAPWPEIAERIKEIYLHREEMELIPQEVRVGSYNTRTPICRELPIPYTFPWTGFRGLYVSSEDIELGCKAMCAMLLRIRLQTAPEHLQIHIVDPKKMGADMMTLPVLPGTPRLSEQELCRLLQQLDKEIAAHDAQEWLCDKLAENRSIVHRPVHIIAIANWDDLTIRRQNDEWGHSESQKTILRMLETDVAARNGVYFYICSKRSEAWQLPVLKVRSKVKVSLQPCTPDKQGIGSVKSIDLDLTLPTEDEIKCIHAGFRNYLSGSVEDTDGKGVWLGNASAGLRAIMGTTPQGEPQYFELGIGKGANAFHALVGGATGSGKSVLLNEIVCSLAERYSPQELRLALLDYKEGTEFAPFAGLPHVFALSIGTNPEFGVETLKWLQGEIERRGALFKEVGVSNITDYRKTTGKVLCRYVVVADEFQVLCTDKQYGDEARALLNDLVRRARSFGVNFILATQTLRDGALEGEAKNQFGCRICLQLAENETEYFLASENNDPAHFNRKGQALLNYAMGMKAGNLYFQSGNKAAPNGMFRTLADINELTARLTEKAKTEVCLPSDRYIYDGDSEVNLPSSSIDPEQGLLLGLRNNMTATPYYLRKRLLDGGLLIIGDREGKKKLLLQSISAQTAALYGTSCPVQTPESYLDGAQGYPLTIFEATEVDPDLEDALAEWQEARRQEPEEAPAPTAAETYQAPAGMESEFAELAGFLQGNAAAMNAGGTPRAARRKRSRDLPLVVSVPGEVELKMMESAGLYRKDFRAVVYLDLQTYNRLSGNYERALLPESQVLVECPAGVVNRVRLARLS